MLQNQLDQSCTRLVNLCKRDQITLEHIREKLSKVIKILNIRKTSLKLGDDSFSKSQTEVERERVDRRLDGFIAKESRAWKEITEHYGSSLNQGELLSLAEVLASEIGLHVDREAKRRKEVLIKWYDENIEKIAPFLKYVVLEGEDGSRLKKDTSSDHNELLVEDDE